MTLLLERSWRGLRKRTATSRGFSTWGHKTPSLPDRHPTNMATPYAQKLLGHKLGFDILAGLLFNIFMRLVLSCG